MDSKSRYEKLRESIQGVYLDRIHGSIILNVARDRGLTESRLAKMIDYNHQSMLSKKLNGKSKISTEDLKKIYEKLERDARLDFLPRYINREVGLASPKYSLPIECASDPIAMAYMSLIDSYSHRMKAMIVEGTIETKTSIIGDLEKLIEKHSPKPKEPIPHP